MLCDRRLHAGLELEYAHVVLVHLVLDVGQLRALQVLVHLLHVCPCGHERETLTSRGGGGPREASRERSREGVPRCIFRGCVFLYLA